MAIKVVFYVRDVGHFGKQVHNKVAKLFNLDKFHDEHVILPHANKCKRSIMAYVICLPPILRLFFMLQVTIGSSLISSRIWVWDQGNYVLRAFLILSLFCQLSFKLPLKHLHYTAYWMNLYCSCAISHPRYKQYSNYSNKQFRLYAN